tara:strand:+ start:2709 stop:3062 length:354 start_codon:yes stop_codon:yes gene_type:complete
VRRHAREKNFFSRVRVAPGLDARRARVDVDDLPPRAMSLARHAPFRGLRAPRRGRSDARDRRAWRRRAVPRWFERSGRERWRATSFVSESERLCVQARAERACGDVARGDRPSGRGS